MNSPQNVGSPQGLSSPDGFLHIPSPIITRRTRTDSTSSRALLNPIETGVVRSFSRSKGHGFIEREGAEDTEPIFVHISEHKEGTETRKMGYTQLEYLYLLMKHFCLYSDNKVLKEVPTMLFALPSISIEGEYVPLPGDRVKYRVCPIPPKFEKLQAVHVEIVNFTPDVHLRWDSPIEE